MNINELEQLAKAATHGEWVCSGFIVSAKDSGYAPIADTELDNESMSENASYIAAANPSAILELIAAYRNKALADRIEELEREVERKMSAADFILKERDALQADRDEWKARAEFSYRQRDELNRLCEFNEKTMSALQADNAELVAALEGVSEKLKRAGASIPAPENKGTIESAITTGLSIALLLVDEAITKAKKP